MKPNKLSHSALSTYSTCGRKYFYHYKQRLRSKTISGALLMGTAIDRAINTMLETKSLEEAIKTFDKSFRWQEINGIGTYIPTSKLVVYAKKDFDAEILQEKDLEKLKETSNDTNPLNLYNDILKQKEEIGFENLLSPNKQFYNVANHMSMARKGHIMLEAYYKQVLPKIKTVLASQKQMNIENSEGDKITGYIDLIVEWQDGKRYIIDNKTSYMQYEQDDAAKSQQLILYYHMAKNEYKVDGVGFIVLYKMLQKNRIKICSKCGHNGTGGRHKTCDAQIPNNQSNDTNAIKRCNGEWNETISPECGIDIILNDVTEAAENLVIETFDEANRGIKMEVFPPNLDACYKWGSPCQFLDLCWRNSKEGLINLNENIKNKKT